MMQSEASHGRCLDASVTDLSISSLDREEIEKLKCRLLAKEGTTIRVLSDFVVVLSLTFFGWDSVTDFCFG